MGLLFNKTWLFLMHISKWYYHTKALHVEYLKYKIYFSHNKYVYILLKFLLTSRLISLKRALYLYTSAECFMKHIAIGKHFRS